jgi:electron transfer flavoprotein beta subunit
VLAATESSDGYTGTVPEQIAEVLGLPSVTFAKKVTIDGGTLKVERQTEAGYDEVDLPAARRGHRVTAGVVEPRYPSFKGIMAAKSKPVDTVTVADLGHRCPQRRLGRRRSGDRRGRAGRGPRGRRDHRRRRRGFAKIVDFLENLKVI